MDGGGAYPRPPARRGKGKSQRQARGAGGAGGSSAWNWSTRGAPARAGAVSGEGIELVGRQCATEEDHELYVTYSSHRCLVAWKDTSGLLFDRFDVRHLLDRLPEERKHQAAHLRDAAETQEEDLDEERYRDLRKLEEQEEGDQGQASWLEPAADSAAAEASAQEAPSHVEGQQGHNYAAVPFSYGSDNNAAPAVAEASEQQAPVEEPFVIPFRLPESFDSALPQTEKLYNIMAKTARFVAQHGPQSEIVLRVKQGDSPTFGFLMPANPLHAFFRLLVERPPELTPPQQPGQSQPGKAVGGGGVRGESETGGGSVAATPESSTAFALLGQAYGDSDEDEEEEGAEEHREQEARGDVGAGDVSAETEPTAPTAGDDHAYVPVKEGTGAASTADREEHRDQTAEARKGGDLPAGEVVEGPQPEYGTEAAPGNITRDAGGAIEEAARETHDTAETIVQRDEATTKIIMKMAEYIARNGPAFEAIVRQRDEQDAQRHWEQTGQPGPRRFPFLDPQHPYHPFFSACLRQALPSAAQDSTQQPAIPEQQQQKHLHEQGGKDGTEEDSTAAQGEHSGQRTKEQAVAQGDQEAPEGSDPRPAKRQKQEEGQEQEKKDSQGDGNEEEHPEKKPAPISGRVRMGWIPKVKQQFVRKRKKESEDDQQGEQEESHKQKEDTGDEALVKAHEEAERSEKVVEETGQEVVMDQGVEVQGVEEQGLEENGVEEQAVVEEAPAQKPAVTVSAALAAVLAATSRKTPPPDDRPGQEEGTGAPPQEEGAGHVDSPMQEPPAAEPEAALLEPGLANGAGHKVEPRRKLSAADVAALVRKGKAGFGGGLGADKPPPEPQGRKLDPSQQGSSQPVAAALQLDEELLQELEGWSERPRLQAAPSTRREAQQAAAAPADVDAEKQRIRKKRLEKARQLAAMMKDKQSASGSVLPVSSLGAPNGNEWGQSLQDTVPETAQKKGAEPSQGVGLGRKATPFDEHSHVNARREEAGASRFKVPDPRIRHVDLSQLLKLRTEAAQESDEERGHTGDT